MLVWVVVVTAGEVGVVGGEVSEQAAVLIRVVVWAEWLPAAS